MRGTAVWPARYESSRCERAAGRGGDHDRYIAAGCGMQHGCDERRARLRECHGYDEDSGEGGEAAGVVPLGEQDGSGDRGDTEADPEPGDTEDGADCVPTDDREQRGGDGLDGEHGGGDGGGAIAALEPGGDDAAGDGQDAEESGDGGGERRWVSPRDERGDKVDGGRADRGGVGGEPIARSQKSRSASAACTAPLPATRLVFAAVWRGGRRAYRACSGTVIVWTAASTSRVLRHPYRSVSQPVSGRKMVLAKPATMVRASSAPPRRAGVNQATTTANAAS
jgi:hypothetical protein